MRERESGTERDDKKVQNWKRLMNMEIFGFDSRSEAKKPVMTVR